MHFSARVVPASKQGMKKSTVKMSIASPECTYVGGLCQFNPSECSAHDFLREILVANCGYFPRIWNKDTIFLHMICAPAICIHTPCSLDLSQGYRFLSSIPCLSIHIQFLEVPQTYNVPYLPESYVKLLWRFELISTRTEMFQYIVRVIP